MRMFIIWACSLFLNASILGAQTVNQGAPADAADAWPVSGPLTDAQLRATPVTISAVDLDIRNLVFATDKVDASGSVLGAGTNNIGDVDVLTFPDNEPINVAQFGGSGVVTGAGGSGAGVPRVTVSGDDSSLVYTLDSAGACTGMAAGTQIALAGFHGYGWAIRAGTLSATIVAEHSDNGGVTFNTVIEIRNGVQEQSGVVYTNPNPAETVNVFGGENISHFRVRCVSYISGSAIFDLRATKIISPLVMGISAGVEGLGRPIFHTSVAGNDGSLMVTLQMRNATPGGSDYGIVTRSLVIGDVAHDVPDTGIPVGIGGRASSTPPTAVATGDRVSAWYGLNGQAHVANAALTQTTAALTSTTCPGAGCVTVSGLVGMGSVAVDLRGTWVAVVQFYVSTDGTNFDSVYVRNIVPGITNDRPLLSKSNVGSVYAMLPGGITDFRVAISSYTSGTVDVRILPASEAIELDRSATYVDGLSGFVPLIDNVDAPVGFVVDEVATATLAEGNIGAARVTPNRGQVARIEGATVGTYADVTASGAVEVTCDNCGGAAASNVVTLSVSESVVAPTAATWYLKRQWTVPSTFTYVPSRAFSAVATAGTRTQIVAALAMGSFNVSTNAFTDSSSVAAPRHYARLYACVTTALSATATTVTVTYTNEEGTTGRTTVGLVIPASAPVGNCFEFQLAATTGQMRDEGVRDVTAVSDTAAPTGVIEICAHNPLHDAQGALNAFEQSAYDTFSMTNPEKVEILFFQAATTAQQRGATIVGAIR